MGLLKNVLSTVLLVFCVGVSDVEGGFIVTPGPSVSINVTPFGGIEDVRYQQVYSASLFANAGVTGPVEIIGLGFSPNRTGVYTADVDIRLNQTATSVGSLSTNLDDNVTGSLTTVFDNPSFSQSVIGGDLTYTLRFNFLSSPFLFDPTTGGNLLLDIRVADKDPLGGWAFYRGNGQGVTSRATSEFADGVGLRTLIEFRPASSPTVPEPSSMAVLGIGIGCVAACRSARRRIIGSRPAGGVL